MIADSTIDVAPVRQWLEVFAALGVPRAALLARLGCEESRLGERDGRIDTRRHHAMLDFGAAASGKPGVVLLAGVRTRAQDLGVVGHLMLNCDSLLSAGGQIVRYAGLLCQSVRWSVSPAGEDFEIRYEPVAPGDYSLHGAEASLSSCIGILRSLSGKHVVPRRVSFAHPDPGYGEVYRQVFGGPVDFGGPAGIIRIGAADARLPIPQGQPYVLELLAKHAEQLSAELGSADQIAPRVRGLVTRHLAEGHADIESISSRLAMSRWTLTRRLKQEGTTFNALLREVRSSLAGDFLRERDLSISEVAFLLGYSEPSAFQRAFRSWYRCSPSEYAARQ